MIFEDTVAPSSHASAIPPTVQTALNTLAADNEVLAIMEDVMQG
jgi:hypothetical protein